jgi:hypothetical protein
LDQGTNGDPVGTGIDDPTGKAATNPVAFPAVPATSMFDPLRTAARGVIVDEMKLVSPEKEFVEYAETVIPGPPDTT